MYLFMYDSMILRYSDTDTDSDTVTIHMSYDHSHRDVILNFINRI